MLKLQPIALVLAAGLIVPMTAQAHAETNCAWPDGETACAEIILAGGFFRRYPPPQRYYRPYVPPTYAAPPPPPSYNDYSPYYRQGYPQPYQPSYPPDLIEQIQTGLDYLGYDPGPVDGVYGGRTGEAIRAFQDDAGIEPDGLPSEDLLAALDRYVTSAR